MSGGDRDAIPEFWSRAGGGAEGFTLTYAVRSGGTRALVITAGVLLAAGGAVWFVRLAVGGGLTLAGVLFLALPLAAVAAGAYCLDVALIASTRYHLGPEALTVTRSSLFGSRTTVVPRASAVRVSRRQGQRSAGSPAGVPTPWVFAVVHRPPGSSADQELVFDGMSTSAEAAWLQRQVGPWVPSGG